MLSSIKSKFLAWFLTVFTVLFLSLGLFLYHELEVTVIGSVDDHLHSEIQLIAGLLDVEEGLVEVELAEAETGEYALPLSGHYYQVMTDDGKILARSPSLSIVDAALPPVRPADGPTYVTVTGPGKEPLRLLSEVFAFASGTVIIQAGESLEEAHVLLRSFRNIILMTFPAFFILSAIGISIITRFSLKRLDQFSAKVERISEKSLGDRLEEDGVESELRPLARSFNRMMNRIEESFARQRRFLSDASHDLRTPTTLIKSYCDVTLRKARRPEEYVQTLERISRTSERMTGIINRILEVSRLEEQALSLKMERINLLEMLDDIIRSFEGEAGKKRLKTSLQGEAVVITGDRERLAEVFTNIIDNAVKYNREGGHVDLSVGRIGSEAVVTVADTGMGMTGGEMERIFDRLYRADESRGVVEGTGLGLTIARTLVEAHGGRIEVSSEPGKGSTFTVRLPLTGPSR